LALAALPFSPCLEREQDANSPAQLGENPGNLFSTRSRSFSIGALR
jgi:hypothetical protein